MISRKENSRKKKYENKETNINTKEADESTWS